MFIQSIEVRKKDDPELPPSAPAVTPTEFECLFEYSALNNGKHFHSELYKGLGLLPSFWSSVISRYLSIDPATCLPTSKPNEKNLAVLVDDSVILYAVYRSRHSALRIGIIGTTTRTIFLIGRPDGGYFFTFDQSSVSAKEAITNLYVNNLSKGPVVFNRTESAAPGFFKGMFECVIEDLTVHAFTVKHHSGIHLSARLYLDPKDSSKNMISVCGMVFGLDLTVFPSSQINRGYFSRPKEG